MVLKNLIGEKVCGITTILEMKFLFSSSIIPCLLGSRNHFTTIYCIGVIVVVIVAVDYSRWVWQSDRFQLILITLAKIGAWASF